MFYSTSYDLVFYFYIMETDMMNLLVHGRDPNEKKCSYNYAEVSTRV